MARRRMIEVSIAHDKALNSLPDFCQLLYLKILPHTDDFGRFEGDPELVKARVDPLSKKPVKQYEAAMKKITEAGLWKWYQTDRGKRVIQYPQESFERINAFLIKQRGNPEYPPHMDSYESISIDMPAYHIESNKQRVESKEQKDKEGQAGKIDRPDSLDEVVVYFRGHGWPEKEARKFWSFYESNGWKVGKNPMKKWRAAAAGWISRNDIKTVAKPGERRRAEVCEYCQGNHQSSLCPTLKVNVDSSAAKEAIAAIKQLTGGKE